MDIRTQEQLQQRVNFTQLCFVQLAMNRHTSSSHGAVIVTTIFFIRLLHTLQENALSVKREFHLRTIHFLRTSKETKRCECYLPTQNFFRGC